MDVKTSAAGNPVSSGSSRLLEVQNLQVHFPIHRGKGRNAILKAVDDVSFSVYAGETLGLVGESGCGKSTLARAIVQLYRPTSGRVIFLGEDLVGLSGSRLRAARREMQMIFQDPYASLNPRMTVRNIVAEPLRNYGETAGIESRIVQLLETVGLDRSALERYPHEFSGGQRQRIGIARALALSPKLVIADEPASALDISIQAQIINLLRDLQARRGLSYLFISHDLSVVAVMSHRMAVMYLGEIVELGPALEVFHRPFHPYTEALISAIPEPDPKAERRKGRILLGGEIPSPIQRPSGCPFHPRCIYRFERCPVEKPALREYSPGRLASCHLLDEPNRVPRPHGRQ